MPEKGLGAAPKSQKVNWKENMIQSWSSIQRSKCIDVVVIKFWVKIECFVEELGTVPAPVAPGNQINPTPHSPHPLLYCPVFFKEYLNSKFNMNKMIEEHSIKYHPSPSGSTSRINPLIFLQTRVFVDFFTNLYVPKW